MPDDEKDVIVGTPSTPSTPSTPEQAKAPEGQNTGEEATPAAADGETPKPEETLTPEQAAERDRKREGARFGRKLDKAYRQRAEAQARADFLAKQLADLQKVKAPEGEPTLEKYDFDPEKYATAKAAFAKTQAEKELTQKQAQLQATQARQKLISAWEDKVEAAEDKYDDWDSIVGKIEPNSPFTAAIMEADNGPDIAHYLGKHPKEAQRIVALPPLSQIREIGKLEAKLLSAPAKPKAASAAPAPITPVSGTAQAATNEPSENDDMAQWIKKRNKQVQARR